MISTGLLYGAVGFVFSFVTILGFIWLIGYLEDRTNR